MNEPEMTFENAASMGLSGRRMEADPEAPRTDAKAAVNSQDFLGNVVRTLLV